MSVLNYIRCLDCKKYLWIGQRSHIYRSEEQIDILEKFFFTHIEHLLRFDNEYWKDEAGFWEEDSGGWTNFEESK